MRDYNDFDDFDTESVGIDIFGTDYDDIDQENFVEDNSIELNLADLLRSELIKAEPDRNSILFKIVGDYKNEYEGVPLKEIPEQNAFIFKLLPNCNLKKIKLDDIDII